MSDLLNGAGVAAMGNIPVVSAAVEILEKILIQAKAGHVTTVGIIMIDPNGGFATPWAGPQIPSLHLGAAAMQTRILRSIESPPKSSIIPARNVG